jgi:hypothetical protein
MKADGKTRLSSDDSEDMLGRKKGAFKNSTNFPTSGFNETVHITMLDPQQIKVFNIKFIVPGMNETNDAMSLAKLGVMNSTASNKTRSSSDFDKESRSGIGKSVKVSTAEVKAAPKAPESKQSSETKAFPKEVSK